MKKETTSLHIKNMVCPRCIIAVEKLLEENGLKHISITLGTVLLLKEPDQTTLDELDKSLQVVGFELIDDRKSRILEKMKTLIIQTIHHTDQFDLSINWSSYLSEELGYEYNYLSGLFSSTEGITLEQYIIRQKMEKVKELLIYDELSVKEIASRLGYSNMAHLSSQFKKIIGLTPTAFKKTVKPHLSRKSLDDIV